MVERMARAMARADDAGGEWDRLPGFAKGIYLDCALAALLEMRDPTEVMVCAAERAVNSGGFLRHAYEAMIDAEIAAYEGKK